MRTHIHSKYITPQSVINPEWEPWEQEANLYDRDALEGRCEGISQIYSTILFGCTNIRTSSNYETCISTPGYICFLHLRIYVLFYSMVYLYRLMVNKTRQNRIRVRFWDREAQERICYLKSQDSRS